ncbi:phosphotransferase enzyme family protein [Klebsiella quasipneumoniae]
MSFHIEDSMFNDEYLTTLTLKLRPLLPRWGLSEGAEIGLLTVSENATFLVSDKAMQRKIVLRVHRPNYSSAVEIHSELMWLNALHARGGINIAVPLVLDDGSCIASLIDGETVTHVVGFTFVAGSEPDTGSHLTGWYHALGRVAGELHSHSEGWVKPEGFHRKVWNSETIIGRHAWWGDWRKMTQLSADDITLLEAVEATVVARLEANGQDADRYGLVHCDMRLANLLVNENSLTVIDFDDCGICWFGWDFATAVSFIEDDPALADYRAAWLAGYRSVRPFSQQDEVMLPVLVMLRRLQLTAWLASHSETATARRYSPQWGAITVRLAQAFLHQASPLSVTVNCKEPADEQ